MGVEKEIFRRAELLVGKEAIEAFSRTRVIIFGVGGVGSWCAESLVRSGIGHLTLVDSDRVSVTNVNRQLMATVPTIGAVKVEALKERLLTINPNAEIVCHQKIYSEESADFFKIDSYDYTIDAIDSLKDKAHLILYATSTNTTLFSSMGAALKIDPTKIGVAEFWKVHGDPLGAALRKKFRRAKVKPAKKFKCVFSPEVLENLGKDDYPKSERIISSKDETGPGDPALLHHDWSDTKAQINGTLAHITAIFGFHLAGLVLQDILGKIKNFQTPAKELSEIL